MISPRGRIGTGLDARTVRYDGRAFCLKGSKTFFFTKAGTFDKFFLYKLIGDKKAL